MALGLPIYQAYIFIVEALELIRFCHHLDKYGDTYANWDATSCSDAQQVLAGITSFEFIVVFLMIYQYLWHLTGITMKLQKVTCDIVQAHQMIKDVSSTYRRKKARMSIKASLIFMHTVSLWQRRWELQWECHELHQGNGIAAMLKLYLLKSTSGEI